MLHINPTAVAILLAIVVAFIVGVCSGIVVAVCAEIDDHDVRMSQRIALHRADEDYNSLRRSNGLPPLDNAGRWMADHEK